jgi:hypothetical protein
MRLALAGALLALVASGCGGVPTDGAETSVAAPSRVPDDGPGHETPEAAALASAGLDMGSNAGYLDAEVIYRHPHVPTDVRVRTSAPDYCAVWAPAFDDRRGKWVAFGAALEC